MKINLSIITLSIGLTLSLAAYAGVAEARLEFNSTAINVSNMIETGSRHSN